MSAWAELLSEPRTVAPLVLTPSTGTDPRREARARAYIAHMPAAIAGAGGHAATWAAARKLVCDFELSEQTALGILASDYNPRCQPPWSAGELAHKVRDAASKATVRNPVEDRPMTGTAAPRVAWSMTAAEAGEMEAAPEPQPKGLPFTWVRDFGPLMEPPKLRWLFRDTRTNKPSIRAGKCYALVGDGGVGKGVMTLQVACSIVTGTTLFDTFEPLECGRVAILAAEDDVDEIWHRLARIVTALDLDVEALREKIGVFPLSGEQVNLLRQDQQHNQQRTETFNTLVRQLTDVAKAGGFEWSLVVMDPLARFGADNVEIDQGAATALVAALGHLASTVPGKPAVQLNHHSSSASVQSGKSNVRGVTGLRNAFRLVLTLDAFDTDTLRGVLLRNDKNNLAPKADPLWLVRMENTPLGDGRYLETAGVLRLANDREIKALELASGVNPEVRREAKEEAKIETKAKKFANEKDAILDCLPLAPDFISLALLRARMGERGQPSYAAALAPHLTSLTEAGLMTDLSDGKKSSARRYARTPGV